MLSSWEESKMDERMEDSDVQLIQEEIEALKAIFCKEGEFIINSDIDRGIFSESESLMVTIDLNCKNLEQIRIKMTVSLTKEYPGVPPNVSLSSDHLNKKQIALFRDNLLSYTKSLQPGPMILDMAMWLQENVATTAEYSGNKNKEIEAPNELVILKLNHMRNRTMYLKTLNGWTKDLGVRMIVFFAHKLIIVVFEGSIEQVKEFLRRFRSCNIDVDCSGKPCKEKMMKFLAQIQQPVALQSVGLTVKECNSIAEIENHFKEINLGDIYSKFVITSL